MSHGMGWDIQKIFRPMGRDECQNFPSHPVPWDANLLEYVPWDGMGWDGMGPSRPTRSPGPDNGFSLTKKHVRFG